MVQDHTAAIEAAPGSLLARAREELAELNGRIAEQLARLYAIRDRIDSAEAEIAALTFDSPLECFLSALVARERAKLLETERQRQQLELTQMRQLAGDAGQSVLGYEGQVASALRLLRQIDDAAARGDDDQRARRSANETLQRLIGGAQ